MTSSEQRDASADDSSPSGGETSNVLNIELMYERLLDRTGNDFAEYQLEYRSYISAAESHIQDSQLFASLVDIHEKLSDEFVSGNIRAVEA